VANHAARLPLKLAGTQGNAFALVAAAIKVGRGAGWAVDRIDAFKRDAMKGDYDTLLRVLEQHFDVA
jgi:hypothetical protein